MGAANPIGAAKRTAEIIRELKLGPMKVAAVLGDDVLDYCLEHRDELKLMENGQPLSSLEGKIVSANAYLGADVIVDALRKGADIVLTGRGGDCSLFLAPMIHEFGWKMDDWDILGKGPDRRRHGRVRRERLGRLLRRSRLQGSAGALEPRLPVCSKSKPTARSS